MAEAVSTSSTPGGLITWVGTSATWAQETKSWASQSTGTAYSVDVTKDLFVIEAINKSAVAILNEALASVDIFSALAQKLLAEELLGVTDNLAKLSDILSVEIFSTTDVIDKSAVAALSETLSVADAESRLIDKRISDELLGIAEALERQASFDRQFSESLYVAGSSDTWASAKSTWASATEAWQAHTVLLGFQYVREILEVLSLLDGLSKDYQGNLSETFGTIEQNFGSLGKLCSEVFAASDDATKNAGLFSSEAFATLDANSLTAGKSIVESLISLADGLDKSPGVAAFESVAASDSATKGSDSLISESIVVIDAAGLLSGKSIVESATIVESIKNNSISNQSEMLGVVENFDRIAAFVRALDEALALLEVIAKKPELMKSESLAALEQIKRNSAAVISDILIGTTDIDAAMFQTLLTQAQATGYGPFVQFMEGDHEYKSALFKAVVTAESVSGGRLTTLRVLADVPDIFDTGTVAISPVGSVVGFNKIFHSPPEVNVSIKGGLIFAAPSVSSITPTGFRVELRDASNNLVAGNVSWAAHGY